jgi:hypothetical protein
MNKLSLKKTVAMAGVALSFTLFSANPAKAASFTFSQGGWKYGGNLSGSFSGDDLNNNGYIETSELSSFSTTFSGNLFGDFPNPTGQPIIAPFSISNNLLSSSSFPEPNYVSFSYSLSTSQLSFFSLNTDCFYIVLGSCRRDSNEEFISVSNTGGSVSLRISRSSVIDFSTTSLSAPVVTPVQQPVPEPSTLAGLLFGGLGFLLRRKVASSSI